MGVKVGICQYVDKSAWVRVRIRAAATVSKTEELKKRPRGECQERIVSSVLEAVCRASGSPFSASIQILDRRGKTWNGVRG